MAERDAIDHGLLNAHPAGVASYGIGAAYAAWLLEGLGADVRHTSRLEQGGIGAFLAAGSRFSAAPALEPYGGVLVTDAPVTAATRAALETIARTARVVWLTPSGLDQPMSEAPATDLTIQAAAGWLHAAGEPDREPLALPRSQAWIATGIMGALASLLPLTDPTAVSGLTVISAVEVGVLASTYDTVWLQYRGTTRSRVASRLGNASAMLTLPCKDGFVGIHTTTEAQWHTLCRLMGRPELVSDSRFSDAVARMQHAGEVEDCVRAWVVDRRREDLYHLLQQHRIPASTVPDLAEVLRLRQLESRGYWQDVAMPDGRSARRPRSPIRVVAEPAPDEPARTNARAAASDAWSSGKVRVVDLAMGWAGPMASYLLAGLGADVIKVESHLHPDWWRAARSAATATEQAIFEQGGGFNTINRGKRGITLDLTSPGGRALARELVASADVLVENHAPGVLERFGLDYATISAMNPGIVVVRMPAYGLEGPEAFYRSYAPTAESQAGMTALIGYEHGPPTMPGNMYGDPVAGFTGALAALAGLAHRQATGQGICLEASQLEAVVATNCEALLEAQLTRVQPPRQGNRRQGSVPSGVFRCAGQDQWVALEVTDDLVWRACAALVAPNLANDPGQATASGRLGRQDTIEAAVAAWTAQRTKEAAADAIQSAGVPAAPVNFPADLLGSPALLDSGFWEGEERRHVGYHLYPTLPMVVDGRRLTPGRPAPLLGEHTISVLAALGVDHAGMEELRVTSVIGDSPTD